MKAATIAFAAAPVLAGPALGRGAPNDVQIAVTANQVDIDAGELAEIKGSSPDVKAFSKQMVTDHTGVNQQATDLLKKFGVKPEDNPTSESLKRGGEANINFTKLATAIALTACAGMAQAQQVQEVVRVTVYKMAEKPSNTVTTPTEPQQFGRDSVYATQPSNPSNPVLAGGLTVDEAGGAPLYAVQLTHPSGPVMEGGNDLQPYGRDSVYVARSPNRFSTKTELRDRQKATSAYVPHDLTLFQPAANQSGGYR